LFLRCLRQFGQFLPSSMSMATDVTPDGMQSTSTVDYRRYPQYYRTGAAEQDILNAEPYASELLPYLHFRGERSAYHAAQGMYDTFMRYRDQNDFVGMDMARKFLEMGWMRTRRYAGHVSGMLQGGSSRLPGRQDMAMAGASKVFYRLLQRARNDALYVHLKGKHRSLYER
jgi:hypothetical protein